MTKQNPKKGAGIESERPLSEQFPEQAEGRPTALRVVTAQKGPQEQQQNTDDARRRDQEHRHGGGLGL